MEENSLLPEDEETLECVSVEDNCEMTDSDSDSIVHNDIENIERVDSKENNILMDVKNSVVELSKKIDEMNLLFVQKIQHTTHEEKIVDQMHSELQKYKDDMYSQLVRPILMDMIEIRDSILRMSQNYAAKPEGEQNIPLKVFRDYAFDVQDILEKNNISIYGCEEGDAFIPIKQRAAKKIETAVAELHGKVAESLSPGYEYMGKTISPEKVAVYLYKEPDKLKGENE